MQPKRITPILCLLAASSFGCASTATVPETYAFLPTQFNLPQERPNITVRIPDYLRQAGLVVQTGSNQLRTANHHLWAEPLEQGIARVIESELKGNGDRLGIDRLEISVIQFHGTIDGEVRLLAYWRAGDKQGQFSETTRQSEDGMGAMVNAQGELLEALARSVQLSLNPD